MHLQAEDVPSSPKFRIIVTVAGKLVFRVLLRQQGRSCSKNIIAQLTDGCTSSSVSIRGFGFLLDATLFLLHFTTLLPRNRLEWWQFICKFNSVFYRWLFSSQIIIISVIFQLFWTSRFPEDCHSAFPNPQIHCLVQHVPWWPSLHSMALLATSLARVYWVYQILGVSHSRI